MLLTFPRESGGAAHGIATTTFRTSADPDGKGSAGPSIRIQGSEGEIQVWHPAFRPTRTKLVLKDGTVEEKKWEVPGPGKGSGWANGFGDKSWWNEEGEFILPGRSPALSLKAVPLLYDSMDVTDFLRRRRPWYVLGGG